MSTITILDPRAARRGVVADGASVSAGEPIGTLTGKRIGIRIDEMWESWGWVAEEWEKALRNLGAEPFIWTAPIVKGAKAATASAEFDEFKTSIDGAIVGLCNCGSCTLWAVHDALEVLDEQVPTLLVATEHFSRLAAHLAEQGGRSEVRMQVLPYPLQGRPEPEVREIARQHVDSMLSRFGASLV